VDVVIAPAGVGTITETNQRLEMLKLTAGDGYLGLQSRCAVRGDFDVEVDFSLLNWPAANFHAVRLAAWVCPQVLAAWLVCPGTALPLRTTNFAQPLALLRL
jgi:hypothetical protein